MFTFNGTTATSMGIGVTDIRRSVMPTVNRSTQEVAGMHGAYLFQTAVGERVIEIDIWFLGADMEDAITDARAIAQWLYSPTPLILSFDDEPDVQYFAQLSGDTNLENIARFRRGTLTFMCSDPFAYATIDDDTTLTAADGLSVTTVANGGGMDTFPIIEVTVDDQTTFIEVACNDTGEFVRVGEAVDGTATATPLDPREIILNEEFSGETMEWTHGTYGDALSDHEVNLPTDPSNPMEVDALGGGSYASVDYGTGTAWHGPCIYKDLPSTITNFEVECHYYFENTSPANSMGALVVWLLDGDTPANIIGAVRVSDVWTSLDQLKIAGFAGDVAGSYYRFFEGTPNHPDGPSGWNDSLPGRMTIRRVNDFWSLELEKRVSTNAWQYAVRSWYDADGTYGLVDLSRVAIGFLAYGAYDPCNRIEVTQLTAYDVTGQGEITDPLIISQAGDVFTFDMRQGVVLLNGSTNSRVLDDKGQPIPLSSLVHYSSSFFSIPTGSNSISVIADAGVGITGTATVTKRWL